MVRRIEDSTSIPSPTFILVGGRLAVDFANSAGIDRPPGRAPDDWEGLVRFLVATGTISPARGDSVGGLSLVAPEETARVLQVAIKLRQAMREMLEARIAGPGVEPEWIARINGVLACTEGYDKVDAVRETGRTDPDYRIQFVARSDGLEWLLAAIARSAAELVAEGPAAPIRMCANPKCGLFFYDDSRTGRRRWCSMATCGNRAKVAAHFRRQKNV